MNEAVLKAAIRMTFDDTFVLFNIRIVSLTPCNQFLSFLVVKSKAKQGGCIK